MLKIRYFLLPLGALLYFFVSWMVPWEEIQIHKTVSSSYLFDLFFVVIVYLSLKEKPKPGHLHKINTPLRLGAITLLGFICVGITIDGQLFAPFRFVKSLALQILILAPIIEEFVFRGALFRLGERSLFPERLNIVANAFLFSLSHLPAVWFLQEDFHQFIYFQLVYTLILGWICARSRERSGGILEPILLHFCFNLLFYIAVKNYGL